MSIEGGILASNIATARELGLARQVVVQQTLAQLAGEPADVVADYLRRCSRSGQFLLGSLSLRRVDGALTRYQAFGAAFRADALPARTRPILLRLIPVAESRFAFIALNEKILQLNGEVARRRQSEIALSKERETLQVTLSSIGDGVIVTDTDGQVTFLNEVASNLIGLRPAQATGRPLLDVFRIANEQTLEPAEDPVAKVLRSGFTVGLVNHTVLLCADGRTVPIDDSAAPVRLEGRIIGVVLTFRDISGRRQAEIAAREADRRKDEFLATLAHELRNPLAPIRNALQIMAKVADDPARLAGLRTMIERQLKHMIRLIDDLMDMSRITQGRLDLRQERVDIDGIIQIAIETSRPLLESKRQQLRFEHTSPSVHIDADLTRLTQVFSNLLNNAAKYSPLGATVSVSMQSDGIHATIDVTDTGIGIPPDMLANVFDMFVQVGQPGQREGLGIGLTLVKRIVELHGGTVEALSGGEGKGSTFRVRLPVADSGADELPASMPLQPQVPWMRARILVADDNRDAAQTLATVLELEGHDVRVAYDGSEAVRLAGEFRPHVALLDIGMPEMNGYQVARRLRAQSWAGASCLVALTGWGQEHDRQQATAAGFDRHWVKPIDPEVVIRLIATILARTS
ncbi:MAG: ATP-binding protein [Steroidobacteraceae bacterium]